MFIDQLLSEHIHITGMFIMLTRWAVIIIIFLDLSTKPWTGFFPAPRCSWNLGDHFSF